MAYSHKFILKSDTTDLVRGLSYASKEYQKSMHQMKASAESLKAAEAKLEQDRLKLTSLQKTEVTKLGNGEKTTELRKQIALQKKIVALQNTEFNRAKSVRKEAELNQKTHINALQLINKEITGREKQLAVSKKITEEERRAYEIRKKEVLAKRETQTNTRRQRIESDKDRLLITSQDEQNARKYAGMLQEVDTLKRRGIITSEQASVASQRLATAQKLELEGSTNLRNSIVRHIRQIESLIVAMYFGKKAYDVTIGRGHEFNKLIERETVGLKLLIAQNLQNVDVLGQAVTAQEKYNYAQEEAGKAIKIVRDINIQTPHTLGETLQIYKLLVPQVLRFGGTLEEVGHITKNVSIAGASMGIEFQQLLKTVDSLMSGQMKESGLKRAMEQFGISQKEINKIIKEGGDVVELFIDKLRQVDPAGKEIQTTWAGVQSQFVNIYDEIQGKLQKPLFDAMKHEIKDLSDYLKNNQDSIVENITAIVELIKYGVKLGGVYLLLRGSLGALNSVMKIWNISTSAYNALILANAKATGIATRANAIYGTSLTATTVKINSLGRAMKALTVGNPVLVAAIALMAGYEAITSKTKETEEKLADAVSRNRNEILQLGVVQKKQAEDALKSKISELKVQNAIIEARRGGTGSALNFIDKYDAADISTYAQATKSEKELNELVDIRLEKNKALIKEHQKSLNVYKSITPEVVTINKYKQDMADLITDENLQIAEINTKLTLGKELNVAQRRELENKKLELQQTIVHQKEGVQEANKILTALGHSVIEVNSLAKGASSASIELQKTAANALALKNALIQTKLIHGEITEKEALLTTYDAQVENANKIADETERHTKLIQLNNNYYKEAKAIQDATRREQEQALEKQKREEQALHSLKITNAQAHGQSQKALSLQIEAINKSNISEQAKALKIDTLKINNIKSQTKEYTKIGRAYSRMAREADRLSKAKLTQIKEETKQRLLLAEIEAGGSQHLSSSGQYNLKLDALKRELSEQKNIIVEAKKMATSEKTRAILQKEITRELEIQKDILEHTDLDPFEAKLRDIFNVGKGSGGVFDNFITEFSGSLKNSLESIYSDVMGGLRNGVGINESLASMDLGVQAAKALQNSPDPTMKAIGYSLETVGALLSNTLSEAEIKEATGRSEFESKSLNTMRELAESNPLLPLTKNMLTHLDSMDNKFSSIANALSSNSGFDFDGSEYVDNASYGALGFSSETKELLGAGFNFGEQTVGAFLEGVDAVGYQSVKVSGSKFWGLVKSEKVKMIESEIPQSLKDDLSAMMQDGINATLEGVKILGFDESAIKAQLDQFALDLGKISFKDLNAEEKAEALKGAFGEQLNSMFDGAMGATNGLLFGQLETLRTTGEELTTTIARVSIGHEAVVANMRAYGNEIENLTFVMTNALVEAAGGLEAYNTGQSAFKSGFFSAEEQAEMTRLTLEHALAIHNVALPASKEQFRALVLETEQKILTLKANIQTLKIKEAMRLAGFTASIEQQKQFELARESIQLMGINAGIQIANNEAYAKDDIARQSAKHMINVATQQGKTVAELNNHSLKNTGEFATVRSNIEGTLFEALIKQTGDYGNTIGQLKNNEAQVLDASIRNNQSLMRVQDEAGQAAVNYGTNIGRSLEAMMGNVQSALGGISSAQSVEEVNAITSNISGIVGSFNAEIGGLGSTFTSAISAMASSITEFDSIANSVEFTALQKTDLQVESHLQSWLDGAGLTLDDMTSPLIASAEAELANLEGLYGTLMQNMQSFASYYGDRESLESKHAEEMANLNNDLASSNATPQETATAVSNLQAEQKAQLAELSTIIALQNQWSDDQLQASINMRDAVLQEVGLTHLNYDNFMYNLGQVSKDMTDELLSDYQKASNVIMGHHTLVLSLEEEANKAKLEAIKKDIAFYENIIGQIDSAYTGTNSYLNSLGKSDYLANRAEYHKANDDSANYIKTLQEQLATDKKLSATREDYAVKFDKYINELQTQEPEATTDDVVESIDDLKNELSDIKDLLQEANIQKATA